MAEMETISEISNGRVLTISTWHSIQLVKLDSSGGEEGALDVGKDGRV